MTEAAPDKISNSPVSHQAGDGPAQAVAKSAPVEIMQGGNGYRPRVSLSQLIEREGARRRRRLMYWWSLLLAVPALAAGVWYLLQPAPVTFAERFRTQPVAQGDVVREVLATGNVAAVTTVQVGAEISGRIAKIGRAHV